MDKLKPCPFCGSEVEVEKIPLWHGNGHGYNGCYEFKIRCKSCGCTVDQLKNDSIYRSEEQARENAIEAWNRRMERVVRCDMNPFNKPWTRIKEFNPPDCIPVYFAIPQPNGTFVIWLGKYIEGTYIREDDYEIAECDIYSWMPLDDYKCKVETFKQITEEKLCTLIPE